MPTVPLNDITLSWTDPSKTDIVIAPKQYDSTSTSLVFGGNGAVDWAPIFQENFLRLLEHFSAPSAPPNPTVGQIYWNTSDVPDGKLYVCVDSTGPIWREIRSYQEIIAQTVAPTDAQLGYLWLNTLTNELSVCISDSPVTWLKLLSINGIAKAQPAPLSPLDGQLWYDLTDKILYAYNSGTTTWDKIGPSGDIDIMGGDAWNSLINDLNKILGEPSTTSGPTFTKSNTWGWNQSTQFAPYYNAVPGSQWLLMYDTMIKIGTLLGISTTQLIPQDFHLPGSHNNQYGMPFMLDQYNKIKDKLAEYVDSRLTTAGATLTSQTTDMFESYAVTWGAGASSISTEFKLVFNDLNHIRGFFNAGGTVNFVNAYAATSPDHTNWWHEFLALVSPISMNYKNVLWGGSALPAVEDKGYYDLTTTYQTMLLLDSSVLNDGTSPPTWAPYGYTGSTPVNNIKVEAKLNGPGNEITIKITLTDGYVGGSDTVPGTLTTQMSLVKADEPIVQSPVIPFPDFPAGNPTGYVITPWA